MKRFVLLFYLCSAFAAPLFTQEPKKIENFGDLGCDELLARLDYFANNVVQLPESRGYIIVYEGKHKHSIYRRGKFLKRETRLPRWGESATQSNLMLKHLHGFRGFSRERFLVIYGGIREEYAVELWLVPQGASPPRISPTLERMNYRKGTVRHVCHELG